MGSDAPRGPEQPAHLWPRPQTQAPAPGRRGPPGLERDRAAGLAWSPCSLGVCWQLSLDKELIDFGSYVVGETASRVITLTNGGGLGTSFRVLLALEESETDVSQSVIKTVSVGCGHSARAGPPGRRPASDSSSGTVELGCPGWRRAGRGHPGQARQESGSERRTPGAARPQAMWLQDTDPS